MTVKRCSKCGEVKTLANFSKTRKRGIEGREAACKECRRAQHQKWRANNPDKEKAVNKKRYAKNPELSKAISTKWRVDNPEKNSETQRKSRMKRMSTARGKLSKSMAGGMLKSIQIGSKNGRHWETLVGFSVIQLKAHIEKLFKPGMAWDNYGPAWHIDHKIPVAAFNFSTPQDIDFKRCWNLKNLQPMWAKENMGKKDKLERPFQPSLTI